MIRACRVIAVIVLVMVALPIIARGDDGVKAYNPSLRGIEGVVVEVAPIKPEIEKAGLSRNQMQADVEEKLRQTGLNLWNPDIFGEENRKLMWPRLYVRTGTLKTAANEYVYVVDLDLQQMVYPMRKSPSFRATTWSTGVFGITGDLNKIKSSINDLVDDFLNAWQSENPK